MKKILFLIHIGNINKSSGILEKVINQSLNMKKSGILYKTYIFYKKEDFENIKKFDKFDFIVFLPLDFYKFEKSLLKRICIEEKVYKKYIDICNKEKGKYDYVYVRSNPFYYNFLKFTKKNSGKLIYEHNSIEPKEYKANNKLKLVQHILFEKQVRKRVAFYVSVTKEIDNYQKSKYPQSVKGIVISNGIDVKKYPIRKTPKYDKKNLNIIFVGNIRYWHGVDRMLKSIANYNGPVKITYNICGLPNQKDEITSLIKKLNFKNHTINQLGYKTHEELDSLFNEAHLAQGSLATFRFLINNASTLKNREYFARGIPIVFSEIDDDISIPGNKDFYFKVPNDDSIINMEEIIKYIERIYLKDAKKITQNIRRFAEENLDYSKKIEKLKEFVNEI